MAKLTVLMPVYNSARFLPEAMDSILNQTFADFEFIIIDDCSTDTSAYIIQSYADSRIRFFRNDTNLGISRTLNRGIELADTDFIARMDADDISYPDRLEKQYHYLQEHPDCHLVSSSVRVISEENEFVRQDIFESGYYYYNLTFICWIYHPTVMYTRKAVVEAGMYTVPFSEDFELFWQISRTCRLYNLPEVLLDYRVTGQSLHQVLKKKEYAEAQREQLLRNLRYYAGSDYTVPDSYLECMQHNFQPLLAEGKTESIIDCIRQLDLISQCILQKENVNRDPAAIREAAGYKRNFIINFFARQLPPYRGVMLLLRLRCFNILWKICRPYVFRNPLPTNLSVNFRRRKIISRTLFKVL